MEDKKKAHMILQDTGDLMLLCLSFIRTAFNIEDQASFKFHIRICYRLILILIPPSIESKTKGQTLINRSITQCMLLSVVLSDKITSCQ